MKAWLLAFGIALLTVGVIFLFGTVIYFFPVATVIISLIVAITVGVRYGWLN